MEPNHYMDASQEKEISLSELLWKVVKSWRFIICLAAVFCVLMTGYKYISDKRNIANVNKEKSQSVKELQKDLTGEEKKALDQAVRVSQQLEQQRNYLEKSLLMQINPYQKNVATLQFYVDTDYKIDLSSIIESDYATELVRSYVAYIENGGLGKAVQEVMKWNIESAYFNELITLGGRISNSNDATNATNGVGATFTIYVTAEDAEKCSQLAEAVKSEIEDYKNTLAGKIGKHDLILVDSYMSVVKDSSLVSQQDNLKNSINSLQSQLTDLQTNMTEIQIEILDKKENIQFEKDDEEKDISAGISKKYLLLGFLLGGFLGCAWVAMRYIFDKYIKSSEELQNLYGMRIFGEVSQKTGEEKRAFGFVDKWIDSLQRKEIWSKEEQLELICTNLKVTCEKNAAKKILLTSSFHQDEKDKSLISEIGDFLRKSDVEVVYAENMIRNAKTFEIMAEIGRVVLIEKVGTTEYAALEKELQLCKEQKAEILGSIIME